MKLKIQYKLQFRTYSFLFILVLSFFSFVIVNRGESASLPNSTEKDVVSQIQQDDSNAQSFVVAFFGDQAVNETSRRVLRLVKREKAAVIIHQGDLSLNKPATWERMVNDILGPDFPIIAVIGNHDAKKWTEYTELLSQRLARTPEVHCTGTLGIRSTCTFRGLTVVQTGTGVVTGKFTTYLNRSLTAASTDWKICSWHKNSRYMQVGAKASDVKLAMYDECRRQGAFIVNGHNHAYARTSLMSSFKDRTVASISDKLRIGPGRSFAVVSGLGGNSMHAKNLRLASNPWWANVKTIKDGVGYGALFCKFGAHHDPDRADCYFKDINGVVHDRFTIINQS